MGNIISFLNQDRVQERIKYIVEFENDRESLNELDELLKSTGIDVKFEDGTTLLQRACSLKHKEKVSIIMGHRDCPPGIDNYYNKDYTTSPLYMAVCYNWSDIVGGMLNPKVGGASQNVLDGSFVAAAKLGYTEIFNMLLRKGAKADPSLDVYGAMLSAIDRDDCDIVSGLIDRGAEVYSEMKGRARSERMHELLCR